MLKFFNQLFAEDSKVSSVRLMSLTCILSAVGIAISGLVLGRDLMGLAALCSSFIAPAFAAKVYQKGLETRQ